MKKIYDSILETRPLVESSNIVMKLVKKVKFMKKGFNQVSHGVHRVHGLSCVARRR